MSEYAVSIGNYSMAITVDPIDADGNVPKGRPNPTRITWTKENIIKVHDIPWPEHKTCRTSSKTLWNLDVEFIVLTKSDLDEVRQLVDEVGPHTIRTAFLTLPMYIKSFSATSEAGYNDYRHTISMKLVEVND